MDIVRAFIKNNDQLLIFITGYSGSGKTVHAEELSKDYKIKILYIKDYRKTDPEIHNKYATELIDIDRLNSDIEKYIKEGLIVSGFPIDTKIINHKINIYINLSINMSKYIENQLKSDNVDRENIEKNYNIIAPLYNKLIKETKVNKFINVSKFESDGEVYDHLFDSINNIIENNLYKDRKDLRYDKDKKEWIYL